MEYALHNICLKNVNDESELCSIILFVFSFHIIIEEHSLYHEMKIQKNYRML